MLSHVRLFVTAWTIACQAPLSMEFSRQEYWNGLPFPFPEDLLYPGIEPISPVLAGGFFITEPPGKPQSHTIYPWAMLLWFASLHNGNMRIFVTELYGFRGPMCVKQIE